MAFASGAGEVSVPSKVDEAKLMLDEVTGPDDDEEAPGRNRFGESGFA